MSLPDDSSEIPSDALEFWKKATGLTQEKQLYEHIAEIRSKALAVYDYPCIRHHRFLKLRLCRHPLYQSVVDKLRSDVNLSFMDVGCCMGCDEYKMVQDGVQPSQIIGIDLEKEFIDLGKALCPQAAKDNIRFIAGDIFDDSFLDVGQPSTDSSTSSNNTLTQYVGRISYLHCCAVFHLFDQERQIELAKRLLPLMAKTKNATIFGSQRGQVNAGPKAWAGSKVYWHSAESFEKLWRTIAESQNVKVRVEAECRLANEGDTHGHLVWSVHVNEEQ